MFNCSGKKVGWYSVIKLEDISCILFVRHLGSFILKAFKNASRVQVAQTRYIFPFYRNHLWQLVNRPSFQMQIGISSPDSIVVALVPIISLSVAHLFSTLFYFI